MSQWVSQPVTTISARDASASEKEEVIIKRPCCSQCELHIVVPQNHILWRTGFLCLVKGWEDKKLWIVGEHRCWSIFPGLALEVEVVITEVLILNCNAKRLERWLDHCCKTNLDKKFRQEYWSFAEEIQWDYLISGPDHFFLGLIISDHGQLPLWWRNHWLVINQIVTTPPILSLSLQL